MNYESTNKLEVLTRRFLQLPFPLQLAYLLVIDIAIGFVYAAVPVSLHQIRGVFAFTQLIFMTITMAIATKRFLEDY